MNICNGNLIFLGSPEISKSIGIIYKSSFCVRSLNFLTLLVPLLNILYFSAGIDISELFKSLTAKEDNKIRILSKVSFDSHTDVLFHEQEILKFSDIYSYQIGKFINVFKRLLLPNYFRDMFTLANHLHSYYTVNCNLFYTPPCRTDIRNFSIRFQGPKFFNSLSPEIQNSESICLFGERLKTNSKPSF